MFSSFLLMFSLSFSVGGLHEPRAVAPAGAVPRRALPPEVHAADRGGRRPRHGALAPLRLLRAALSPNIPQVSQAGRTDSRLEEFLLKSRSHYFLNEWKTCLSPVPNAVNYNAKSGSAFWHGGGGMSIHLFRGAVASPIGLWALLQRPTGQRERGEGREAVDVYLSVPLHKGRLWSRE